MKTMAELFWNVVEELKEDAGPFEAIKSPMSLINSTWHPLRSSMHELNSPYHPLNSRMTADLAKKRASKLIELLQEYVVD